MALAGHERWVGPALGGREDDGFRLEISSKIPLLFLSLMFLSLFGCAFSTVTAGPALVPDYQPEGASTIVVGQFKTKKLSEAQRHKLVQEIIGELKKEAAFAQILDEAPAGGSGDQTVLLDGNVVNLDEGSRALQFLIGLGAGASKLFVTFHVSTADGRRIAAFSAERTYAGGLGIGGASFVSTDELLERVAKDIALTVAKWKRGELRLDKGSQEVQ